MKVRIKNNRLALETKSLNLEDESIDRLRAIGAKYQIGANRMTIQDVETISRGRTVVRQHEVVKEKTAETLIKEIRKYLTITTYIPRELFTDEQRDAFMSNELDEEKDINTERAAKIEANIMIILPPFEKTGDSIKEARLVVDITEPQWDYLKKVFNTKFTKVKDDEGRTIKNKESYVHRLMMVEFIPENDEDKDRLAKKDAKIKTKDDGKESKSK